MQAIALARVSWSTGRQAIAISGLSMVALVAVFADRAGDDGPRLRPVSVGAPVAEPMPLTDEPTPAPEPAAQPDGPAPGAAATTDGGDEPTVRAIGDLPLTGPGTFDYASSPGTAVGAAPYLRYSVAVEHDIGLDPDQVAAFVDATLADPRSWAGDGATGFERIPEGGTFTLVVASPATVDRLCRPLDTAGRLSCGANGYIALNLLRWETAVEDWPADLATYRTYLVNHEVGHYVVGAAHASCPATDELAPVMMQQTKGLDGCRPNGWPYPDRGA